MVRHLLGFIWNHFKLWRPHHWYSYTGEILPLRSQEMVHCGTCIYYFAMFPLFPSSLHTQFIQRFVPQYQTDSHTTVPFWFSSILSSLGETKNPSLPVSFLSLCFHSCWWGLSLWWLVCYTAVFSVVTQRSSPGGGGGEEHYVTTLNVADYMMTGETIGWIWKINLHTLQRIYYFWAVDSLQLLESLRATIQGCGFSLFSRFITFRY